MESVKDSCDVSGDVEQTPPVCVREVLLSVDYSIKLMDRLAGHPRHDKACFTPPRRKKLNWPRRKMSKLRCLALELNLSRELLNQSLIRKLFVYFYRKSWIVRHRIDHPFTTFAEEST